jgi:beta-glucanase (GH16 family)
MRRYQMIRGIILVILSGLMEFSVFTQPPVGSAWKLTFSDEFEGTGLDGSKWDFGFGWGTNSGAFSEINRPGNVFLEDSMLVIRVDTMSGNTGWWSGAINTKYHFSQMKGYFEARIRAAEGNGLLSAFWGKPVTEDWPPEIDFVEILGKNNARDAFFTVHYLPGHLQSGGQWTSPGPLSEDFHIYGLEWGDSEFVWYVDGVVRRRSSDGYASITGFGEPFYIMLNVHVKCKDGGCQAWTGVPDETNIWPARMEVDWVRVYEPDYSISTSITNIQSGHVFEPGVPVDLEAVAENSSGSIEKVELYVDEEKAGITGQFPFRFTWLPAARGRYALHTMAYSDSSASNPSDPVYVTVAGNLDSNLIINPGFEFGTEAWRLDVAEPYSAEFEIDEDSRLPGVHSARIRVQNGGTSLSNIRLQQKLYLEGGKAYHLSLRARSSVNRKALLSVSSTEDGRSYSQAILNLTAEETLFSSDFLCNRTDYRGMLDLFLGGAAAEVLVDSVYLVEQDATGRIEHDDAAAGQAVAYPNPCNDRLILEFEEKVTGRIEWSIYDLTGRCLISGNSSGPWVQIGTRSLDPGMYVLIVGTANQIGIKKYFMKL